MGKPPRSCGPARREEPLALGAGKHSGHRNGTGHAGLAHRSLPVAGRLLPAPRRLARPSSSFMERRGAMVRRFDARSARRHARDPRESRRADPGRADVAGQHQSAGLLCPARHPLRGHRDRYRRLPAPSGPGGLHQPLRRLQGQGDPARRDAAGGRRQVALCVGSQPPGRGDPRSSFGFEFQPCDRGCRAALGGPLARDLRDARSRAIGPPPFLRPDGPHDSARLPSTHSAGRSRLACRR